MERVTSVALDHRVWVEEEHVGARVQPAGERVVDAGPEPTVAPRVEVAHAQSLTDGRHRARRGVVDDGHGERAHGLERTLEEVGSP